MKKLNVDMLSVQEMDQVEMGIVGGGCSISVVNFGLVLKPMLLRPGMLV